MEVASTRSSGTTPGRNVGAAIRNAARISGWVIGAWIRLPDLRWTALVRVIYHFTRLLERWPAFRPLVSIGRCLRCRSRGGLLAFYGARLRCTRLLLRDLWLILLDGDL